MPDGEQVTIGGYDGEVEVLDDGFEDLVPPGRSLWEMSTKRGIQGKANDDYDKRTNNDAENWKAETAFVFVTPRHWKKRDEWAQQKNAEPVWCQVVGLNSRSLQKWLETAPAIASMFWSHCLRREPWGLATTEMIWEDCAKNVDAVHIRESEISSDFVIADRHDKAGEIARWLLQIGPDGTNPILRVFGPSITEAEHFIAAVVCALEEEQREQLSSSMLWIKTDAGARQIASLPSSSTVLASSLHTSRAMALRRTQDCRVILLEEGEPQVRLTPSTVVIRPASVEERVRQLRRLGCSTETAIEACTRTDGDYMQLRRVVFFIREEGGAS